MKKDDKKTAEAEAPPRVWQLDALRGLAMILMTVFHALVDIRDFFGFADVRYFEPPLMYIGRSSAILFILISGVSCRFSKNNIMRGLKVLICGMIVTVATFFFVRDLYVRFGILHFLGSAMIIIGLAERLVSNEAVRQRMMYIAAPLSLLAGRVFGQTRTELPFLFIFGVTTTTFASYDFYPLFPWLGIFFAGYAAGGFVVKNRDRLASMRKNKLASAAGALGRVSLIYYLLHQPALLVVMFGVDMLLRVTLNL